MPEEAQTEALRELDRLAKMPPAAAEYTVARTYLDWLVAMPWSRRRPTPSIIDRRARRSSTRTTTAWRRSRSASSSTSRCKKIRPGRQGPDPLLRRPARRRQDLARPVDRARAGPRSSSASRSAACATRPRSAATGARTSARCPARSSRACGGPGRKNPVFMLDEIDKLGTDFRGDPASALLEVLDPEQNGDVPRPLPRRAVRPVAGALHHHREHARHDPGAAARPHGGHRARRLHRGGEARDRPAAPGARSRRASTGSTRRAGRRRSRRRRCACSRAATRARPACATSSARSPASAARSRARRAEGRDRAGRRSRPTR